MGKKIRIRAGEVELPASLNDTGAAELIWNALPIKASASTWGEEIYFSTSVEAGLEAPREVVEVGDIGYWPSGRAFCIFFGPTPVSSGDEIRPASAVDVIGKIEGDAKLFRKVRSGEEIVVEKA